MKQTIKFLNVRRVLSFLKNLNKFRSGGVRKTSRTVTNQVNNDVELSSSGASQLVMVSLAETLERETFPRREFEINSKEADPFGRRREGIRTPTGPPKFRCDEEKKTRRYAFTSNHGKRFTIYNPIYTHLQSTLYRLQFVYEEVYLLCSGIGLQAAASQ